MRMRTARSFPSLTAILLLTLSGATGWSPPAWGGDEKPTALVLDLGSESWTKRETAQSLLLEGGIAATSLLEEASRSANPELAYRARYVLSRIDPRFFQCQILKIELAPTPDIAAVAVAAGAEDGELVARGTMSQQANAGRVAARRGYPEDPTYTVSVRTLSPQMSPQAGSQAGSSGPGSGSAGGSAVEVTVTQQSQGTLALEARPILIPRQSVAMLRTGDQLLYERVGLHLARERHPFLTLIRARTGRKSSLTQAALPESAPVALARLADEIVEQLNRDDADAHHSALEIASFLRSPRAASTLQSVLKSPTASSDDIALASLGLDDRDLLRRVIGKPGKQDGGLVRGAVSPPGDTAESQAGEDETSGELRIRAAARLLELGDEDGLEELLERLAEGNPSTAHVVMASLADFAQRGSLSAQARKALLEAVYSEDFLGHTIWEDAETEYLLSVACLAIDPAMPEAPQAISKALENLAKLARGELGPVNLRLRPCLDSWKRVRARGAAEGPSELDFILELLPTLRDSSQISEAVGFLETAISDAPGKLPGAQSGQIGNDELDRMLRGLLAQAESDVSGLFPSTVTALLRVTRALTIAPGQLTRVVQALVDAGEWGLRIQTEEADATTPVPSQVGLYLRQLEDQLAKWTALDGAKRKAAGGTFNAQPWREWLGQGELAANREREILAKGGQLGVFPVRPTNKEPADAAEQDRAVVYYEFDLLLDSTSGVAAAAPEGKSPGQPSFRVLGGRRVELTSSKSISLEDRWGNRSTIRVEPDSTGAKTQAPRFRVNSRLYLFAGVPSLTAVQTKTLSAAWMETSDQFFGSRTLPGGGAGNYRTLYCVDFLDSETAAPPIDAGTAELWAWFLDHRLLKVRPDASRDQWTSVLGILRTLRLKESAPLLKEILASQGAVDVSLVDIAHQLLELGDPAGSEFLKKALESPNQNERLLAALALCETGSAAAATALLGVIEKNAALARAQGYQVVTNLGVFLERSEPSDPTRQKVIGFLVSRLDDIVFQNRAFSILAQESGLDFGFESAQVLNDPQEKSRAVARAVEAARTWWAARSQK